MSTEPSAVWKPRKFLDLHPDTGMVMEFFEHTMRAVFFFPIDSR